MSVTAGKKRTLITLEQAVKVSDGQGGKTTTWALRAQVWAHERPLSGTEALRAAQVTAVLSSVWEIWFRDDLSVTDRIRRGARVLHIESFLDPAGDRRELHLFASEVQT